MPSKIIFVNGLYFKIFFNVSPKCLWVLLMGFRFTFSHFVTQSICGSKWRKWESLCIQCCYAPRHICLKCALFSNPQPHSIPALCPERPQALLLPAAICLPEAVQRHSRLDWIDASGVQQHRRAGNGRADFEEMSKKLAKN